MAIRFLQAGMGVRGSQWAQVIRAHPNAQNVAYMHPQPELGREILQKWGESEKPLFGDFEEALQAVKPDAVLLATPPETHHAQVVAAFKHGCHVLCEKPLSEEFHESLDMVAQAERYNRLLMVGHNFRYLACSQKLRQMIAAQELGEPGFGHFVYLRNRDGRRPDLNKYPLVMKQPMLLEQSIHHLDLMRYCYQDEVITVSADTWRPKWSVYQDDCCVSALLTFRSGMRVNYMGTWTSGWNRFCFEWRTDCSGGVIIQKAQFSDLYKSNLTPGLAMEGQLFKTSEDTEPLQPIPLESTEAFRDDTRLMLNEFLDAMENKSPLVTSGKDHLKTLGLTLACVAASETSSQINMDNFLKEQGIPPVWL